MPQTALYAHRLGDALAALRSLAAEVNDGEATARLEALSENYAMMLRYMRSGAIDTERGKLFGNFLRQAFQLSMTLQRAQDIKLGNSLYASTLQTLRRMDVPQSLDALKPGETTWRNVFDLVFTSAQWTDSDVEALQNFMGAANVSLELQCLVVSGVMLGALYYYDVRKHKFLFHIAACTDPQLQARAITGAVLVQLKWAQATAFWPEIDAAWQCMAEQPKALTTLADLLAQFSLSLETKNIEQRMNNDILPEVMQHTKGLKRAPGGLTPESIREEMERLQANPEWAAAEGRFADKMKEIIDMQQKGADVFIGSFKALKQNLPFFSVAANWFCPFTLAHPDLPQGSNDGGRFVGMLTQGTHLCESDKYAFCLMLSQMQHAGQGANQLADQLAAQMEEAGLQPQMQTKTPTLQEAVRSYVIDLYRYFKLFSRRDKEADPFMLDLMLLRRAPFDALLRRYPKLRELADFVFSIGSYDWAKTLYQHLEPEAEVLQKLGYCHQSHGDYAAALAAYEKAHLMQGDSAWTLRQMAVCCRRMGQLEEACAWYAELEQLLPEDAPAALRHGECLVQLGHFEEAQKKFFKTYYLAPDNRVARRAIAWCCLQMGKEDEAETYYTKILADAPEAEDWLNAGHAAWLMGNVKAAVERYAHHLQTLPTNAQHDIFAADRDFLIHRGFTPDELCIMADAARGE